MGLLEWVFESSDPDPVGKAGINSPDPDEPPRKWLIWITVVIGLFLACAGLYWVFYDLAYAGAGHVLTKLCCLALYIVLSHFINAAPDTRNLGWLGGVVDNPFRISDDFNRWLLFVQIILLPGKLVAYSVVISWLFGRHLYKNQEIVTRRLG
jgi:hypothetical protein